LKGTCAGSECKDERGVGPALKPTYFATNCRGVADNLGKKCDNTGSQQDHRHVPLMHGRAKEAGVYPP
jgi:hypothetical protein